MHQGLQLVGYEGEVVDQQQEVQLEEQQEQEVVLVLVA